MASPFWIFQFLYGAIKSPNNLIVAGAGTDFNSSMVRLKDLFFGAIATSVFNFNSSMVRLKELTAPATFTINFSFQFLYGAIKRLFDLTPSI